MTLLEWKKNEMVTYGWIRSKLGSYYSRQWLSMVFNGRCRPAPRLLRKLMELTGLSEDEILGNRFTLTGSLIRFNEVDELGNRYYQ